MARGSSPLACPLGFPSQTRLNFKKLDIFSQNIPKTVNPTLCHVLMPFLRDPNQHKILCIIKITIFVSYNCKRLSTHTGQEQACTRITRLFVRLFVRHHAENGPIQRKMVVDCPLVITTKVKLFFRPDKTRKKELMVQPVFCIVDAGSCSLECLRMCIFREPA